MYGEPKMKKVKEVGEKNDEYTPFNLTSGATFESDLKYTDELIAKQTYRKHHDKFFQNFDLLLTSHNGVINEISPAELTNLRSEIEMNEGFKDMLPNLMAIFFKGELGGFGVNRFGALVFLFQLEKCDKFLIAMIEKDDIDTQVVLLNAFSVHYMCLWRDKQDWRAKDYAIAMLNRWEYHKIVTKAAFVQWVQEMFAGKHGANHPVLQLLNIYFRKYFPRESETTLALIRIVIVTDKWVDNQSYYSL